MSTVQHYPLIIFFSEEDAGFIAEAPDLPGCGAWGATEADAAREAQDAIAAWVQAARAAGKAIPVPPVVQPLQAYSGKFLVRVPRSLHARLARRAARGARRCQPKPVLNGRTGQPGRGLNFLATLHKTSPTPRKLLPRQAR